MTTVSKAAAARIAALRQVADPEERAQAATRLAHEQADLATPARARRNHAALCAVYGPRQMRQKDALTLIGVTRRAWKVIDRRAARDRVACPVCLASPGVACVGVTGPAEAIHDERQRLHVEVIAVDAAGMTDPAAVASEQAAIVAEYEATARQALAIRKAALDELDAQRDGDGRKVYQPSDLARIAGLTTARIGHMGYRSDRRVA